MSNLAPLPLPVEIRARMVPDVNGLQVHVLEAGEPGAPVLLLLHGFPELAYSWRRVMPSLAAAGFHVVAPDLRGFGRTTGGDARHDGDLAQYRQLNVLTDVLALLRALGIARTAAAVGHDMGAQVAAYAALVRPDIFPAVVMMSAPFSGPPGLVGGLWRAGLDQALAALDPPRKSYGLYYCGPEADADMRGAPQGVHAFLRAYFHVKSGDWAGNDPVPLAGPAASEFARLPTYYVMNRDEDMAATVAPYMPTQTEIAACRWLPDADLAVFAAEYGRTGFQGGLQWYRCRIDPAQYAELRVFAGRTIDVPAAFIAGARDWGIHQTPGALDAMATRACSRFTGIHLVPGAGHWVQQEAPEAVVELLLAFLAATSPPR
jgi:pimeloyl-ACP methyl ester carboxylesterase